MRKHKIVAILWEDHTRFDRTSMRDPNDALTPTLSVGILYKKTKKFYVLVTDIERYGDRDDCTYTVIGRHAIISQQDYGEIELTALRE